MTTEEFIEGKDLIKHFWLSNPYDSSVKPCSRQDISWGLLMEMVDVLNGLGKGHNFIIYKTYAAFTVEKEGKFYKDYHFAHSEYFTAEQSKQDAIFLLIVKFIKWDIKNKIEKDLVESK
jgi:hypothetical protein